MLENLSVFQKQVISTALLQFDSSVRDICRSNGCGGYGKSWACPNAPCRFPEKLFPSLEGFGFNVMQLAKTAGMDYYKENTVTYFGMLLF